MRLFIAFSLSLALAGAPAAIGQARPVGKELDAARKQFERADWDGAIRTLERLLKAPDAADRAEAETLARRARLERALVWADAKAGRGKQNDAAREFEALAAVKQDVTAGSARIASAALAWRQKKPDEARRLMHEGLETWRAIQENKPVPEKGSLEEDVLAIRDAYAGSNTDKPHPYQMVPSITTVRLANGQFVDVAIGRSLAAPPVRLYLNEEQEMFLKTLLTRFRADWSVLHEQRLPQSQATDPTTEILRLIVEFFPVSLTSYSYSHMDWNVFDVPEIFSIAFEDELRSKAEICSGNSFGGGCGICEKRDGVWRFVRATSMWAV